MMATMQNTHHEARWALAQSAKTGTPARELLMQHYGLASYEADGLLAGYERDRHADTHGDAVFSRTEAGVERFRCDDASKGSGGAVRADLEGVG